MKRQRIFITGAAGYIGRHFIQASQTKDSQLRAFSRQACPGWLPPNIEWVQGDISDTAQMAAAIHGCDAILHLASLSILTAAQDPELDYRVSVFGTGRLLAKAREAQVKSFVFTSSAQVYGPQSRLPLREDMECRPQTVYGQHKLMAEEIALDEANQGVSVLGLFNVYGGEWGGVDRATAEASFARRLASGKAPVLHGHPGEGRDFIHMDDVVRAIWSALEREGKNDRINVGSGRLTTLQQLAEVMIGISGLPLASEMQPGVGQPLLLQADTKKASSMLQFTPSVPLEEGLRGLIEHAESAQ